MNTSATTQRCDSGSYAWKYTDTLSLMVHQGVDTFFAGMDKSAPAVRIPSVFFDWLLFFCAQFALLIAGFFGTSCSAVLYVACWWNTKNECRSITFMCGLLFALPIVTSVLILHTMLKQRIGRGFADVKSAAKCMSGLASTTDSASCVNNNDVSDVSDVSDNDDEDAVSDDNDDENDGGDTLALAPPSIITATKKIQPRPVMHSPSSFATFHSALSSNGVNGLVRRRNLSYVAGTTCVDTNFDTSKVNSVALD